MFSDERSDLDPYNGLVFPKDVAHGISNFPYGGVISNGSSNERNQIVTGFRCGLDRSAGLGSRLPVSSALQSSEPFFLGTFKTRVNPQ